MKEKKNKAVITLGWSFGFRDSVAICQWLNSKGLDQTVQRLAGRYLTEWFLENGGDKRLVPKVVEAIVGSCKCELCRCHRVVRRKGEKKVKIEAIAPREDQTVDTVDKSSSDIVERTANSVGTTEAPVEDKDAIPKSAEASGAGDPTCMLTDDYDEEASSPSCSCTSN